VEKKDPTLEEMMMMMSIHNCTLC